MYRCSMCSQMTADEPGSTCYRCRTASRIGRARTNLNQPAGDPYRLLMAGVIADASKGVLATNLAVVADAGLWLAEDASAWLDALDWDHQAGARFTARALDYQSTILESEANYAE